MRPTGLAAGSRTQSLAGTGVQLQRLERGAAAAAGPPAALADVAGISPAVIRAAAMTAPARRNTLLWVRRLCMIPSPSRACFFVSTEFAAGTAVGVYMLIVGIA